MNFGFGFGFSGALNSGTIFVPTGFFAVAIGSSSSYQVVRIGDASNWNMPVIGG